MNVYGTSNRAAWSFRSYVRNYSVCLSVCLSVCQIMRYVNHICQLNFFPYFLYCFETFLTLLILEPKHLTIIIQNSVQCNKLLCAYAFALFTWIRQAKENRVKGKGSLSSKKENHPEQFRTIRGGFILRISYLYLLTIFVADKPDSQTQFQYICLVVIGS